MMCDSHLRLIRKPKLKQAAAKRYDAKQECSKIG